MESLWKLSHSLSSVVFSWRLHLVVMLFQPEIEIEIESESKSGLSEAAAQLNMLCLLIDVCTLYFPNQTFAVHNWQRPASAQIISRATRCDIGYENIFI